MAIGETPETPEEEERRLSLERAAQALAIDLGTQLPKGVGFAVMLFDFGDRPGNLPIVLTRVAKI